MRPLCLASTLALCLLALAGAAPAGAAGWLPADQHGPPAFEDGSAQSVAYVGSRLAVGPGGHALAAWNRVRNTGEGQCCTGEVQFAERGPGGAWSAIRGLPGTEG